MLLRLNLSPEALSLTIMIPAAPQRNRDLNLPHPTTARSISILVRSHLVGRRTCSLVGRGSVYCHAGRIRHHVPPSVQPGL